MHYDVFSIFASPANIMTAPALAALRLTFLALLLWVAQAAHAVSGDTAAVATPDHIRIGVLSYRGPEQALKQWQGHADYLAARLPDHRFTILPLSYPELGAAVHERRVELIITNTGHYTELEATGQVSRIATRLIAGPDGPLNRFGGTAITRAGRSDIRHYRDLAGKTLLIPDKSSLGGWQVHLREALDEGLDLQDSCRVLRETENHEEVVRGVLAGEADAGFVRSDLVETMAAAGKLDLADIQVIDAQQTPGYPFLHSTRLYPEWPLARVGDFPEELAKQILVALLALPPDAPAARQAGIYGWTLPHNYQPVLDLFREARLGPYAQQQITPRDILQRYGVGIALASGGLILLLSLAVAASLRSNRRLKENEARLRLAAGVFEDAQEGILITDPDCRIVEANAMVSQLTGYSREELLGQTPNLLRSDRQSPEFFTQLWRSLEEHGVWRGELWNKDKHGHLYAQRTSISAIRDENGRITHYVGLFSDVTQLKENQHQLERMAYYDALTGLPNRVLLADRLNQAIAQNRRHFQKLAVCYLDLDDFKPINDTWGHAAGDRLLVEVARRLGESVRQGDTVSRLGGDEFVILLSELDNLRECEQALERISDTLRQPLRIGSGDTTACVSASIGVALYPADGIDPDTLLRHADQAMYAAKQAGRNRYHLFRDHAGDDGSQYQENLADLRRALAQDELILHYQPVADLRQGRIVGAEALVRWRHPERGLVPPETLLAAVEQTGMHPELGHWVIATALQQIADWQAAGHVLAVSLNLSAQHLQRPEFPEQLAAHLARHPGIAPRQLELEISETAALQDLAQVIRSIQACRQLGVRFAIDNFGTGYSSLAYLKELPMQTLKIDRTFIHAMAEDPDALAIVDGIIGLGYAFRRRVVAEGVETLDQGLLLRQLGCDLIQGYAIAHPMAAADLPGWIADWRTPAAWQQVPRWSAEDLPLLAAEADLTRWTRQLTGALDTPAEPPPQSPPPSSTGPNVAPAPADSAGWRFGEWIDSPEYRQRYGHLAAARDLPAWYAELLGRGAALLVLHGKDPARARQELAAVLALGDRLRGALRQLCAAVQEQTGRAPG